MLKFLLPATLAFANIANPDFELVAVKTQLPPQIDGEIEEDEWKAAARIDHFTQFKPQRGEPSEQATQVSVMYDDGHLYVAFRLQDTEAPTSQLTRRDADLFNDDSVILILDSYFDRRSAPFNWPTNAARLNSASVPSKAIRFL